MSTLRKKKTGMKTKVTGKFSDLTMLATVASTKYGYSSKMPNTKFNMLSIVASIERQKNKLIELLQSTLNDASLHDDLEYNELINVVDKELNRILAILTKMEQNGGSKKIQKKTQKKNCHSK